MPTPLRAQLPAPVIAAVRTISQTVWREPYRPGRGPAHYASGSWWPTELRRLADHWERLASAARVVAEFMEPCPHDTEVRALGELRGRCDRCGALADAPSVWDASVPPGGMVCAVCGMPTETVPCPEHQPIEYAK